MPKAVKEIERKFLIEELPEDLAVQVLKLDLISQIHFLDTAEPDTDLRIRSTNNTYFELTKKTGKGMERLESTIRVPRSIWEFYAYNMPTLNKTRRTYPLGKYKLQVDSFPQLGFLLAEIEFPTSEEANAFVPPDWFVSEVTHMRGYTNKAIWERIARTGPSL